MKSFKELVNEEKTIIAYHGTNTGDIDKFDLAKGRAANDVAGGGGIYLATGKGERGKIAAINYAKSAWQRNKKTTKPYLYKVKITLDPDKVEDIGSQTGKATKDDNQAIKYTIDDKTGESAGVKWRIIGHDVYIVYDPSRIEIIGKMEVPLKTMQKVTQIMNPQ
jgi:hypothetical protein